MKEITIEKVSETEVRRIVKEIRENVVIDLQYLDFQKENLEKQKQQIIADFDTRIAEIDNQINEAKSAGVKTWEDAGKPNPRPDPKTVERKD